MNQFICKLIDRWVIRAAASRLPKANGGDPHFDDARRLLDSPDFFAEMAPPANISFTGGKNFQFPSPVVTASPENNLVTGRISRCGKHWRQRPVVVLLHSWNDRWGYRYRFPWLAKRFNRRGINSVMFELPYHYQRRPRRGPVRNFISGDVGRSMEAVHQALAEINSVVNWLRAQGCPRVCLMGLSLGAWLAGLVACYNESIDCAVFITPVSRMDRMIDEVAFCDPIRRAILSQPMDLSRFNLTSHKPKLTRGAMLLVAAEHDVFVPMETTQELWAAWGNPEMWTMPHGHISIMASTTTMKRASKWIGIRLRTPESQSSGIRPDQVLG